MPSIVQSGVQGLEFKDEVETANALVPKLKKQGVEAIVVLIHEGGVLSDPNALRVIAVGAEWTGPAGADPLVAAGVTLALLLEPLLERLEQLVETAERLDQLLVVLGKMPQKFLAQPFLGNLGADIEDRVDALEITTEREIEAIEMLLVLDEACARQRIKVVERERHDTRLERFEQRQELARRDRQLERFEMKKEVDEHRNRLQSCVRSSSYSSLCLTIHHETIAMTTPNAKITSKAAVRMTNTNVVQRCWARVVPRGLGTQARDHLGRGSAPRNSAAMAAVNSTKPNSITPRMRASVPSGGNT